MPAPPRPLRAAHAARLAVLLAATQAVELLITQCSPAYGDEHLDHLGVPRDLRPYLPAIKAAAVVGLLVTRRRPRARTLVAHALVSYYSAAATFHVLAGDAPVVVAPAAANAALAAAVAW